MKKLFTGILALSALFSVTTQAQTADDIINKHNDAIGGKDVLAKVKSIYFEGSAAAQGNDFPTTTTVLAGKGFKTVTSVNGSDIIQCFTDTGAWAVNPFAGQTAPTAMPAELAKRGKSSLIIGGPLGDYKGQGYAASLEGTETINGVNAYKIKLSQGDISILYYIDPNTYYVLKSESQVSVNGSDVTNTTTYSDYKKTDIGFVVPYTLGISNMGNDITITYTTVTVNKDVDPNIFTMPTK
jgi:outer membrane lipoprotein-sorting protein